MPFQCASLFVSIELPVFDGRFVWGKRACLCSVARFTLDFPPLRAEPRVFFGRLPVVPASASAR